MDGSIIGETEKAWNIGIYGQESFWAAKSKCKETGDAIIIPAWMTNQSIHINEEVCCQMERGEAKKEKPPGPVCEQDSHPGKSKDDASHVSGEGIAGEFPGDFRNAKPDENITKIADTMQVCIRQARRIVEAELNRDGLSKDRECEMIQSIGVSLFIQSGRK